MCAGYGMRLAEESEIAARQFVGCDGVDSYSPRNTLCHSVSASRLDGELNMRRTSKTIKLASLFFALFLLTGDAFPTVTNKQERTKTISVHIDGFMKSKSGAI